MHASMSLPRALLTLAAATSCLLPTAAAESKPWPYNLPPHQKYWPEHEALARRHNEVERRLATQAPVGMRKMSGDPGEMFFLDYWRFEEDIQPAHDAQLAAAPALRARSAPSPHRDSLDNTTLTIDFLPPFLPHAEQTDTSLRFLARNIFDKRNFQCPAGTGACTSIQRPDSCCGTGETCVIIPDTGLGDVGCCPDGQTCAGSVSQCQASLGFSSCPGSSNGGCCIPDYSCQGVGCVKTGYASATASNPVVTITVNPGASTPTTTPAQIPVQPVVTVTQTVLSGNTVVLTSTIQPGSTRTVYTTVPVDTTVVVVQGSAPVSAGACTAGYQSCAASLGGGCCPTDRACGSSGLCPAHTSSSTGIVPAVRPTSGGSVVTVTTTTNPGVQVCPTGYYMCSATYIGGCCQVGRNCDTTSCPIGPSDTIAAGGATIVVPAGGAGGAQTTVAVPASPSTSAQATIIPGQAYCANGWYGCAADAGGGCCPSGYGCGQSCTMTASGQEGPGKLDKVAPAIAAAERTMQRWGWGLGVLAAAAAAGMVLL